MSRSSKRFESTDSSAMESTSLAVQDRLREDCRAIHGVGDDGQSPAARIGLQRRIDRAGHIRLMLTLATRSAETINAKLLIGRFTSAMFATSTFSHTPELTCLPEVPLANRSQLVASTKATKIIAICFRKSFERSGKHSPERSLSRMSKACCDLIRKVLCIRPTPSRISRNRADQRRRLDEPPLAFRTTQNQ